MLCSISLSLEDVIFAYKIYILDYVQYKEVVENTWFLKSKPIKIKLCQIDV